MMHINTYSTRESDPRSYEATEAGAEYSVSAVYTCDLYHIHILNTYSLAHFLLLL